MGEGGGKRECCEKSNFPKIYETFRVTEYLITIFKTFSRVALLTIKTKKTKLKQYY